MSRRIVILCSLFILLTTAAVQGEDSVALGDFLTAAKIPDGYATATRDIKVEKKVLGKMIIVSKGSEASKAVVSIQSELASSVPARRAATKAYINVLASTFTGSGFKIVEKGIPDIEKETFDKPILVDLAFANADGKKVWTHQSIFFTDKGFDVQVIADDADTFASLKKWSMTIKPKP